jgi:hypothetical protein
MGRVAALVSPGFGVRVSASDHEAFDEHLGASLRRARGLDRNSITYCRFVKKRADAEQKAFELAVVGKAGIGNGCNSVSYPKKEPSGTKV